MITTVVLVRHTALLQSTSSVAHIQDSLWRHATPWHQTASLHSTAVHGLDPAALFCLGSRELVGAWAPENSPQAGWNLLSALAGDDAGSPLPAAEMPANFPPPVKLLCKISTSSHVSDALQHCRFVLFPFFCPLVS